MTHISQSDMLAQVATAGVRYTFAASRLVASQATTAEGSAAFAEWHEARACLISAIAAAQLVVEETAKTC